jgi:TolA-binding protein
MFEALIPEGEKSKLLPSILFQAAESRLALTETIPARDHYLKAHAAKNVPATLAESILLRLGETQNMTDQYKEAQKSYEKFIKQYNQSQWLRNARYGMAYSLEKQLNFKKAIEVYSQLLPQDNKTRLDKWMVQARYQIGECWFNLSEYDKAMAEFVSVEVNAQGYPDWRAKSVLEMGRILIAQKKYDDAKQRLQEVLKRFPKTNAAKVALKYLDELRLNR